MKYYFLYKTTNLINGKFYIGVHKTTNLDDDYLGSGKYFNSALNKYGKENFKREILEFFNSEKEMYLKESEIVNEEFIKQENNYNIKLGGNGGFDFIRNHPDYIKWLSLGGKNGKGRKITKENIEKHYKGINGPFFNKHHTEETKRKIGLSFKNKHHTEETKRKIGLANSINQLGEKNSNYGKCWIYNENLKLNKTINKFDLIPLGWIKGRKMKF